LAGVKKIFTRNFWITTKIKCPDWKERVRSFRNDDAPQSAKKRRARGREKGTTSPKSRKAAYAVSGEALRGNPNQKDDSATMGQLEKEREV